MYESTNLWNLFWHDYCKGTGRVSQNYERCREPEIGLPLRVLNGKSFVLFWTWNFSSAAPGQFLPVRWTLTLPLFSRRTCKSDYAWPRITSTMPHGVVSTHLYLMSLHPRRAWDGKYWNITCPSSTWRGCESSRQAQFDSIASSIALVTCGHCPSRSGGQQVWLVIFGSRKRETLDITLSVQHTPYTTTGSGSWDTLNKIRAWWADVR